jgi:hypothetical protein
LHVKNPLKAVYTVSRGKFFKPLPNPEKVKGGIKMKIFTKKIKRCIDCPNMVYHGIYLCEKTLERVDDKNMVSIP